MDDATAYRAARGVIDLQIRKIEVYLHAHANTAMDRALAGDLERVGKVLDEALLLLHGATAGADVAPDEIRLPVKLAEAPVLRFALDHALDSISEAHPKDRAQLGALVQRLEAEERRAKGVRS